VPRQPWTRWGRHLDPEHVLPEYPRPQLVRDSHLNLNGWWDYAITPAAEPATSYDGRILVPFSPEAPLSGVNRQLRPDERLTYRRTLTVPEHFTPTGGRLLLHFGAVDQTCTVHLNGVEVGRNVGGYQSFSCDLTDAIDASENTLVVVVRDLSDGHDHATGKQRLRRGGIWYTAQSGIWQTVWLEAVPEVYVERLDLVPDLEDGSVLVTVHVPRAARDTGKHPDADVTVRAGGRVVGTARAGAGIPTRMRLSTVRPWSPEDPFLHDVEVALGEDRVRSYVAMRSVGTGPDERGVPRLLLNGRPYLHAGILDQGYWPDGLMTAPADEAMVHDIVTMRDLGFTMLRKHVKVEPMRWYHHCDRLGMLVWQDLVNGGRRYRTAAVTWPGRLPPRVRDLVGLPDTVHRSRLGRPDEASRRVFRVELARTVEQLRNVPSIAVWVPFNEGWGQFDALAVTEDLRALDGTRPVDHASGWHDQGGGDLRSVHVYRRRFRVPRRRRDPGAGDHRPLALTEYGGRSLVAGTAAPAHADGAEPVHGYGTAASAGELTRWFVRLHDEQLTPAVPHGLSATVYTQLSDVEDELNGLLGYDREMLKVEPDAVRGALARLRGAVPHPPHGRS
jgi:beta-galactosidase/beta-glucuronidase